MSYKFEAQPKVVQSRTKYRDTRPTEVTSGDDNGSSFSNLMKDARIKTLSSTVQEAEYIRIEKERIKLENMHRQLVAFKANKKMSPYDIKPSPAPRVTANLTFFLTDSTDVKAPQTNMEIQTDIFKEKPKTPPYIPKKTGRDVSTQIEDNELFNFDREVTPIIDVMVTKTIEQSMIEIEEEEEIRRIKEFKEQYWKRRQEDEQKWKSMLQKELETIAAKDKKLEEYRLREEKRIRVLRKLQAHQIAKTYLRDVGFNAISFLHDNGFYQNDQKEELINKIPDFFAEGVIKTLTQRYGVKNAVGELFNHIEGELIARREKADQDFKKKQQKRKMKRINHSKDQRLVRFAYLDDSTPSTYFVRFISKLQEQDLGAFFEDYKSRISQLKEKLENGEVTEEEYTAAYSSDFPEMQTPENLRVVLDDFQKLGFNVANNMYYQEVPKEGFFDISVSTFDKEGRFLYQIDKNNTKNSSKSIKYIGNVKDNQSKVSDDLGMKINLSKVESEVNHIVLSVEIHNLDQSISVFNDFLQYSRFRLSDFITDQTIEETNIFSNFKLEELKDTNAEAELGGKILCYYLYRTQELGWVFESVKVFKNVPIETYGEFNHSIEKYLQVCLDEQFKASSDYIDKTRSAQESFDSKDKAKSKDNKNAKNPEPVRVEEEEVTFGVKFNSRTFGPLDLKVTDTVESIQQKVSELLEKEAPLLHQSFEYGYEVVVADNELVRPTQIRKIGPVTSFVIKRKEKPYEEPAVEEREGEGEGEEDQEGNDSDDN